MDNSGLNNTFLHHGNLPISNTVMIGPIKGDVCDSNEILEAVQNAIRAHVRTKPEMGEDCYFRPMWQRGEGWTLEMSTESPFKPADLLPAIRLIVEEETTKAGLDYEAVANISVSAKISPTMDLRLEELKAYLQLAAEARRKGEKPPAQNFI